MSLTLQPIGVLESCYLDKFGTPRQPGLVPTSFGRIRIFPEWQPADSLQGLEAFSHIWVLFHFHQNQVAHFHAKVHPPRMGGGKMGVFATRSPHRPNPVGLSLVKLDRIESPYIYISGIDIINETPVFDIKPYLSFIEAVPSAVSGWAQDRQDKRDKQDKQDEQDQQTKQATQAKADTHIEVIFPANIKSKLAFIEAKYPQYQFQDLVTRTLKLDPRPTVYKGYEQEKNSPYRQTHAVRLIQYDVHFEFISKDQIQIIDIIDL
ncbi:MAG: tRNA (N6-threonylcarbamoyladenosine(37)-N6)-methyltransferase TrmO [Bdellovibrionaceae bacterium]|nr:tRNA (N6-threonylcarbamoyladenosine(37)-N6)-methyltransferase TrmO [Pseudobdellovibrionaceae bacterium]